MLFSPPYRVQGSSAVDSSQQGFLRAETCLHKNLRIGQTFSCVLDRRQSSMIYYKLLVFSEHCSLYTCSAFTQCTFGSSAETTPWQSLTLQTCVVTSSSGPAFHRACSARRLASSSCFGRMYCSFGYQYGYQSVVNAHQQEVLGPTVGRAGSTARWSNKTTTYQLGKLCNFSSLIMIHCTNDKTITNTNNIISWADNLARRR